MLGVCVLWMVLYLSLIWFKLTYFRSIMKQVLTTYLNHSRGRFLEPVSTGVIWGTMAVTRVGGVRNHDPEVARQTPYQLGHFSVNLKIVYQCFWKWFFFKLFLLLFDIYIVSVFLWKRIHQCRNLLSFTSVFHYGNDFIALDWLHLLHHSWHNF